MRFAPKAGNGWRSRSIFLPATRTVAITSARWCNFRLITRRAAPTKLSHHCLFPDQVDHGAQGGGYMPTSGIIERQIPALGGNSGCAASPINVSGQRSGSAEDNDIEK
jgi:hypothetical protein